MWPLGPPLREKEAGPSVVRTTDRRRCHRGFMTGDGNTSLPARAMHVGVKFSFCCHNPRFEVCSPFVPGPVRASLPPRSDVRSPFPLCPTRKNPLRFDVQTSFVWLSHPKKRTRSTNTCTWSGGRGCRGVEDRLSPCVAAPWPFPQGRRSAQLNARRVLRYW